MKTCKLTQPIMAPLLSLFCELRYKQNTATVRIWQEQKTTFEWNTRHIFVKSQDFLNYLSFCLYFCAYQEMYLQHMIRSMLKQLQLGERDQSLLTFIDKAMRVEERKKLLESHYSQELSLLYILQEDYDRAKYYTNYAMQLFMEVCSHTSSLSVTSEV